jgi:hypothetical protein
MNFGGLVENVGIVGEILLEFVEHGPDVGQPVSRETTLHQGNSRQAPQRGFGIPGELPVEIAARGVTSACRHGSGVKRSCGCRGDAATIF